MKYLGNKTKLLNFIDSVISNLNLEKESALDLFAGTGSVSGLFAKQFKSVDSVDVLELSKALTMVKLNQTPTIQDNLINQFNDSIFDGFVTNHYSTKVGINIFTEDIANHIDGCIELLKKLKNKVSQEEYYFLLNSVIEAADFRSNIMGSYESFYKKGWRKQALQPWKIKIFNNDINCENIFYKMSVEDFLLLKEKKYSLVYCDSPYNGRQYSSVFHVPETICNLIDVETKGKVNKPTSLFISKFSQKRSVKKSYQNLVDGVSEITDSFLVSYSNEGLLSVDDIVNILRKKFSEVKIFKVDYRKFNTNRKKDKNIVNEFLIYGKK